ncbi:MAG TPA: hypothetical protein ENN84_06145 [Candidatus Marinimicrobia bacterium]|nr:hypothetical protein [Candidatus Neomarinimicrobiota bacterium]
MPIISLTHTETKAYKDEEFIQSDAKEVFFALVERFLSSIQSPKNQNTNTILSRVHNTILINGKRGMGKTSFILSVVDKQNSAFKEHFKDISLLGIIDPTLIETKEHVFLNIVSLIKERIETDIREAGGTTSDPRYRVWIESLKRLARGLSILDGIGSDDQLKDALWDSPELILERGLANSKHGHQLERHFHHFITESLRILEKKAFFLIFDDIDTSLKEGKAILEILRKYLTTDELFIAMLGDIDLYATIVRQLQWEKMDPHQTLKNYENIQDYLPQIEHLEEQYLTKILKPENRITLKTLLELKPDLKVQTSQEETFELGNYVQGLVNKAFMTKDQPRYTWLYETVLLRQSTRSVIQVLKGWEERKEEDLSSFVETLRQVFFTTLKKKLEPFGLLEVGKEQNILNIISLFLLKKGFGRDNHMKLLPEFSNDDENISMLFLNSTINAFLEPRQYLGYFVRVGYALERFGAVADRQKLEKFIDHIGLDSNESNANMVRRLLTTFTINSNTHNTSPVFFGNFSLSKENIKEISSGNNFTLFLSRVYNPKGGHYHFFSLFNLIGVLADISESESAQQLLSKSNLIRDFYSFFDPGVSPSDEGDSAEIDTSKFDITEEMKNSLVEWSKKGRSITQKLSAADLAKIWIRLVYTINEIDSRSENKGRSYSEILKLYRAALLNAAYVHCEQKKGKMVEIKNPSTDAGYFEGKIKTYQQGEEYTLFDYLLECPALQQDAVAIPDSFKNKRTVKKLVKKDFKKLSLDEQKKAIDSVSGWQEYSNATIGGKLREKYSNVPSKLDKILEEMKTEQ